MSVDAPTTAGSEAPNARFHRLVAAHGVSSCGNYLNLVASALFAFHVTGSGLGVGLLMALRLGAGSAAGFAAGAVVARFDRRRVMICTDLGQALAMTVLAVTADRRDVVVLGCALVVLGAGNCLFTVALRTAVPELVGHRARVRANGLLVTAKSVAMVAGFAAAGPVIGFGGFAAAFAVNAASFVVSAAALVSVPARAGGSGAEPAVTRVEVPRIALSALAPVLLFMVLLRGIDALASASHNVALPVLAATADPDGAAAFMSRFWIAWAVGVLSAHQVVKRWGRLGAANRSQWAFGVATCAMSICFTLAFTGLPVVALLCVVLLAGLADGITEIAYTSRLQEAPDHRRARLFGLSATAETTGFAIGMVASGVALEALPTVAVVAVLHGLALCLATAFLFHTAVRGRGSR